MHALSVPDAALRDEKSVHMLGAWIAEQGLHCSLNYGFFEANGHGECEAWGILLADVVRHIANARRSAATADPEEAIAAIVLALQNELAEPSSAAEGEFVSRPN